MIKLIDNIISIASNFIENKEQAKQFEKEALKIAAEHEHEERMQQMEINKTQAAHPSIFVAGARPFVIWGCMFAILILAPVASYTNNTLLINFIDNNIVELLLAILGLSGMRTYEKLKGVETKRTGK